MATARKSKNTFWAGFVDGALNRMAVDDGFGGWGNTFHDRPELFLTKADALRRYQDVRRVVVVEVKDT